jgi:Transposase DDE domain
LTQIATLTIKISRQTSSDNKTSERKKLTEGSRPENPHRRQPAPELANTEEFVQARRRRKKVEALFAELKNQIGLRRLRLRRMKFVREQFFLAAAAQNIKRLGAVSQPTDSTHCGSHHLAEVRRENSLAAILPAKKRRSDHGVFQHPRMIT